MKAFFREGFHNPGNLNPSAAAAELERIRQARSALTREVVVEEARPDDSPIHRHFEWDDSKAAHAHRLTQAGQLLRSIKIIVHDTEQVQLYVNVKPADQERQYLPTSVVVQDADLYADAARRLMIQLNGISRTLSEMEALAGKDKARARTLKKAAAHIKQARQSLGGA